MGIKVAPSTALSYGIGVQNRYSAFLADDEDLFTLGLSLPQQSHPPPASSVQKQNVPQIQPQGLKSNKATVGQSAAKLGPTSSQPALGGAKQQNGRSQNAAAKKSESSNNKNTTDKDNQNLSSNKRTQHNNNNNSEQNQKFAQQHARSQHVSNARNGHQSSHNQQGSNLNRHHQTRQEFYQQGNNPKLARNQHNSNAGGGTNNSQSAQTANNQLLRNVQNKPNYSAHNKASNRGSGVDIELAARPARNQFNNHSNEERKTIAANEESSNELANGTSSREEEKRRRQYKRSIDLKYKDPQKRDARRQQSESSMNQGIQAVEDSTSSANETGGPVQKGVRFRRNQTEFGNNQDTEGSQRWPKSSGNGLGRPPFGKNRRELPNDAENRESNGTDQREFRNKMNADRLQRTRNNFGDGRVNRVSRNDISRNKTDRDEDSHKPIPNFSDKLDFPSLAS